jgi:DNA polymerase-3 subunit epsilon
MLGTTKLSDGRFVAVDIETTGCCPGSSDVIEIGATLIEAGRICGRFESFVRPRRQIPLSIVALTGITDAMVADAPEIGEVMVSFASFADAAVLVAHNHRFDIGFLDYEAERALGRPFPRPVLDTLALSRRLNPDLDRHNLRFLAERYGAVAVPSHRAAADAAATAEVLLGMFPEVKRLGLTTADHVARFSGLAHEGVLARKLVLATHLPDTLGVYLLRNDGGDVIYVGRAKNLRTRVRSYFYYPADHVRAQLATEIAAVSHICCPSELDALLLESRLLHRYQPRFNKDPERGRRSVYLRMDDRSRFPALTVVPRRPRTGLAIGPLTNPWAARVVAAAVRDHFGLRHCARRVNSTLQPCRTAAAGCPQPCAGLVTPAEYQRRVAAALDALGPGAPELRLALQAKREHAAAQLRYEDAIVHRDAMRALDRTMSALDVVRAAAAERAAAIVEVQDDVAVVHFLRYGRHAARVRLSRADVANGEGQRRLLRAAYRVCGDSSSSGGLRDFSPRELTELFIIDLYRRQSAPHLVTFDGDPETLVAQVLSVIRRRTRILKKLHAAPSVA